MDSDSSEKSSSITRPRSININLKFGKPPRYQHQLIQNISQPYLSFNYASQILLHPLINYLKLLGYGLDNAIIWYYSQTARLNVYCGNDPLPQSISVPLFELRDKTLQVISREAIRNQFGTVVTFGSTGISRMKQDEQAIISHKNSRRTKQRKIGFIIQKVSRWRKLYNGLPNTDGEIVKMTLEEAAGKVSISKKSLDDYLLQLRFGRRYGFNFQEHKDDKVGVLRAFVKKFKSLAIYSDRIKRGEQIPRDIIDKLKEPGTPACKHNKCCFPDFALPFKTYDVQVPIPFISQSSSFE